MTLARLVVGMAGVCVGLAVVGCSGSGKPVMSEDQIINHRVSAEERAAAKSAAPIAGNAVTLWVNGMGCPLCATNIDKQLERVKGVSSVKVDLGQGIVELGLAEGAPHPSPAALGEAVEDAGFTLVKVVAR